MNDPLTNYGYYITITFYTIFFITANNLNSLQSNSLHLLNFKYNILINIFQSTYKFEEQKSYLIYSYLLKQIICSKIEKNEWTFIIYQVINETNKQINSACVY